MFTVEELFRQLSYGQLSGLNMANDATGSIAEQSQARLISYANEGLLRLHSRFVLREDYLTLKLSSGINNYHLTSVYALTNDPPAVGVTPYIQDTEAAPFKDDLIRVLKVVDSDGREIPLNDSGNTDSYFTPQPQVLQIPAPVTDTIVGVIYQARHPILAYNDDEQVIHLPPVLQGALKEWIAHNVFSHMNGQDNAAKAAEHAVIFETICNEVLDRDLVSNSVSTTTTKFNDRGFV